MLELIFSSEQAITVLTVFLGLIGAVYAANRQFRSSAISENRQRWINQLRLLIAELLAVHQTAGVNFKFANDSSTDGEIRVTLIGEAREQITRMLRLINEIELMINPNEPRHRDLVLMIKELRVEDNLRIRSNKVANIVAVAQAIFKEEWIRVKRGK